MIEKLKVKTPIAIVGLGISGESVLNLLLASGVERSLIATYDKKAPADFSDEGLLLSEFKPETLVVSPGVPLSLPWIHKFRTSGKSVTSELSIAFQFLTTEKVIAVTGSVGKSTVVSLLGAGLEAFSPSSFVGGNLGTPLAKYSKEILQGRTPAEWIALELSSYQLENFNNLRSDYSAVTFLTANHMERYATLQDYYETKWFLIGRTAAGVVLNSNGGDLIDFAAKKTKSLHPPKAPPIFWAQRLESFKGSRLLGDHNQDNLSLAGKLAEIAGWPDSAITGMKNFSGLPHRMENLGTKNGITFVNDSKATTIESVKTAVYSLLGSVQGHIHVLLGGKDKNLPWEDLQPLGKHEKLKFYFFGACAESAQQKSKLPGDSFSKMSLATESAKSRSKSGDVILLSPGGTSFDEFKNFEERGNTFRSLI